MSAEITPQQPPERKVYSEARGKYSLVDGGKVYQFEFPINTALEENFAALAFLKDKLMEAMASKEKAEKEKTDAEVAKIQE